MDNLPNVSKKAARKEAWALLFIFGLLYAVTALINAGAHAMMASIHGPIVFLGYGVALLSWLFGIAVTAVLLFSLWDWWSDLKSCHNHGVEQNQVTSGVPFMPTATKH